MWCMKPDLTIKAILVVIALLLGAIVVKVYVFPGVKAQSTITAQPQSQQGPQTGQQMPATSPDLPRPSAGPSKSEAAAALAEYWQEADLNDYRTRVDTLKCRNDGDGSFDCLVLYTDINGGVSSPQKTVKFEFAKIDGKWRAIGPSRKG